jgi:putative PIG3 family NAD(P)H quinone oxidoreductase
MKAVVADTPGAAEVLRIADIEAPVPAAGQILVAVEATSVNRPDIVQRQGHYPPPPGESGILGLEIAGTIAAVGPGVAAPAVGQRVFALVGGGGYAELAVAWAAHALPIPERLTFEQAACIAEAYVTAYQNLFLNAGLEDGESVLVHGGGGGVGTAAIQLVKALCPKSPVLATASAAKLERVTAQGADLVVDYGNEDFAEAVRRFTDGRGVDVILDHVGAAYLEPNLKALGVGGRLVIIGVTQGSDALLSLGRLMLKRQSIIGSVLRPRPQDEKAGIIAAFARTVMPLFESGRIAPVIDRVFPIEQAADAHRLMESSGHFGKIVLRFGA